MLNLSRHTYRNFFIAKHLALGLAKLDRRARRPDYHDLQTLSAIRRLYDGFPDRNRVEMPFPRRIFMLWQQGWDQAPEVVRTCALSWQRQNPSWDISFLSEADLPALIPGFAEMVEGIQVRTDRSNIARLALLGCHGGVWADATLFCARPLDDWLPPYASTGLFIMSKPRPYRLFDIWFMAGAAGNPAFENWLEIVLDYRHRFRRTHHYYWTEYLFELLGKYRPNIMALWDRVPALSAMGPLIVGGVATDRTAPREVFDFIDANVVPVHKLSHKWTYRGSLADTPLAHLTGMTEI